MLCTKLFRRDSEEGEAEGLPSTPENRLSVKSCSEEYHRQVESFWERIRDRGNKVKLMVSVYYTLLIQGDFVDKTLLQLQKALCSQAVVL